MSFTYITAHSPTLPSLYLCHSSFSNPSIASPTSQLILQPFSYVTSSSLNSPGEPPMKYPRLIELCIMFLGATVAFIIKVRLPGVLSHAKGIYSLKMFLFCFQLSLSVSEVDDLQKICLFMVKVFVKWWSMSS